MRPRWLPVTIAAASLLGCQRQTISSPTLGQLSLLGYVTQFGTNQVDVVDIVHQAPVGQPIGVGQGPIRAILSPGGSQDYLYVANKTDNTVSFVNRRTASVEKNVPAGTDPEDLTYETLSSSNPDDEQYLFVSNPSAQTVTRINVATENADATWDYKQHASGADETNFTPAGIVADTLAGSDKIYVVSSKVLTGNCSGSNCTTTGVVSVLTNQPGGLFNETSSIALPGAVEPYRMVIDKTGNLFISDQGAAQVFMIQNPGGSSPQVSQIQIPGGSPTSGLALTPDGSTLYATMPAANEFVEIPVGTQQAKAPFGSGGTQPEALAMSSDGGTLWIANVGSSTIYSSDLSGNTCNAKGQPCQPVGPIPYTLDSSTQQPPGDLVLAPGI